MTEFERKRVLDVLTAKIRANEWGSIRLNQVSLILQEAGIDRSIYGGIGPKRWLGEHFPELFIDGSNGMETVYLAGDMEAREMDGTFRIRIRLEISPVLQNSSEISP